MKTASVMIVEHNPDIRNTLRHAFEDRGYLTWTCPGNDMAPSIVSSMHPNFVLLDLDSEDEKTLDLLDTLKEISPSTRIILGGRIRDARRIREAMDHGAEAFLIKQCPLQTLFEILENRSQTKGSAAWSKRAAA